VHSNRYTFIYAAILTVITAILLALSSEGLKPAQEANIALEKKMNILNAVRFKSTDKKEIEAAYTKQVRALVVNSAGDEVPGINAFDIVLKNESEKAPEKRNLPIYIVTADDGKRYYVLPMLGVGLWGPIWGYLSLEEDFNTVYGSYFDHKGETPGLGAEISTDIFQDQFKGKKMFDSNSKFVSVRVIKLGSKPEVGEESYVHGISGGTITSAGTDKMIMNWVQQYIPYFSKHKSGNPG
jgi:Na+-transporting NADH:ubiquinone oxidoreductase subunit C